jgi:glycosyltransferase 2 family protein
MPPQALPAPPRPRGALGWIRIVLGTALVLVLAHEVWRVSQSELVHGLMGRLDWLRVAAAVALTMAGLCVTAYLWCYILRINGAYLSLRQGLPIFFVSHLGRYLPGQVWALVGKVVLSSQAGVRAQVGAQCVALEAILGILTASLLALTVLPFYQVGNVPLGPLVGIGLVAVPLALHPRVFGALSRWALRVVRRTAPAVVYSYRQILTAAGIHLVAWQIFGVAFHLLLKAIDPASTMPLHAAAGTFAAAWVVGYLSILTPAGIGVREGVLIVLLGVWMPAETATLAAVGSRILATTAELLGAGLVLGLRSARLL